MPDITKNLGSISHGTLRSQDLLRAFADEIERQNEGKTLSIVTEARATATRIDADDLDDDVFVDELTLDMMRILDESAPDGCYFGTHIGDGSDFGYWPNEE